nr:gliding motility-associated C-terminal domain-containing protein [uncultured Draconibacterium sp.]
MKKFLPKKNFTRTLLVGLVFLLLGVIQSVAQTYPELVASDVCEPADSTVNCTSSSTDLNIAFIGLSDGTRLTDSNIGNYTNEDAYLFIDITDKSGKYDLYTEFNLVIYDATTGIKTSEFIQAHAPGPIQTGIYKVYKVLPGYIANGEINSLIGIEDMIISWDVKNNNIPTCLEGNYSQCNAQIPDIIAEGPFIATGNAPDIACYDSNIEATVVASGGSGDYEISINGGTFQTFDGFEVYTVTNGSLFIVRDVNKPDINLSEFTVTANVTGSPLNPICPDNVNLSSCSTGTDILAAYNNWVSGFSYSGGSNPVITSTPPDLPAYNCSVPVELIYNYIVADDCGTESCSSTFSVAASPVVALTAPEAETIAACTSQEDVNTAFTNWLTEVSYSGGCNTTIADNNTGAPAACGGSTTVTWTVSSDCEDDVTASATFTVTEAPVVALTAPEAETIAACTSQEDVNTAFTNWLTEVSYSGGCNTTIADNNTGAPAACGGSTTVTWTVSSDCEDDVTASATFTVTEAPVVALTAPEAETIAACTSQEDVNTAFTNWLTEVSYSGGCNTTIDNDNTGAPAACGGSTTVTWTVSSDCEDDVTASATFTVTEAPVVALNAPEAETIAACTSQEDVNTAFTNWLTEVSYSGGCNTTIDNDNTGAPAACGGSTTVTWTVSSDCEDDVTASATFTVTEAPVVALNAPEAETIAACTSQEDVNTAFTNWLTEVSYSGGCNTTIDNDNTGAPAACGGSTTVTWTVSSDCEDDVTASATFTVTEAPVVALTAPEAETIAACTSQEDVNTAFTNWLTEVSYSGGCNTTIDNDNTGAPAACGGSTTVTWTVSSDCEDDVTASATFTVTEAPVVALTAPEAETIATCTSQEDVNTAFTNWLTEVSYSGGCNTTIDNDNTGAPAACGGSTTVTWTVSSDCEDDVTASATFTVTEAPVVALTAPEAETIAACTSQEDVNTAFTNWLTEVSYSGGCNTTIDNDNTGAPAACGGSTTVTWTVSSDCEDDVTASATFTVTEAPVVALTAPEAETIAACTSQEDVNTAFTNWLTEVSYSGGCNTTIDNDNTGAPAACGGSTTVTWTVSSDCEDDVTASATFTVTEAPVVALNAPEAETIAACTSQEDVNTAFTNWLTEVSYSGGCNTTIDNDNTGAPAACGGSTTVTWTVSSDCEDDVTASATFTVTEAPVVALTAPEAETIAACTSQEDVNTAFTNWLTEVSYSGGCNTTIDNNNTGAPAACGGSTTVTWTVSSDCEDDVTASATFTVTEAPVVALTAPEAETIAACTSQEDVNTAFTNWLTEVSYSGGCNTTIDNDNTGAPAACGGSTTVTWTVSSDCEDDVTASATFTVTEAPVVALTAPEAETIAACTSQEDVNTAFTNWLTEVSYSGGCNTTIDNDNTGAPAACGGSTTVTWTVSSDCEDDVTASATFTVTEAPVVALTAPEAETIAACTSQEDVNTAFTNWLTEVSYSGGCNTTIDNNNTGAPAACGGSTTVTWTVSSDCEDDVTASATFTVTEAPVVALTAPEAETIAACTSQEDVNTAFTNWLTEVSYSGGCNTTIDNDNTGAPAACGGSTTVTWTVSSDCEDDVTASATFTVTEAPVVALTAPEAETIAACTSQEDVNTAFTNWLTEVSYSGGCNTTIDNDNTGAPAACGGSTTVTWTVSSDCEDDVTASATFTVTEAPVVALTAPEAETIAACTSQEDVNTAFTNWLTEVSYSGGCNTTIDNDNTGAPAACGGSTTVTWTVSSDCEDDVTASATFTVTEAPVVALNAPEAETIAACTSQEDVNTAFTNWLTEVSYSGGCNTTIDNDNTGAPAACGGSTTVTWTVSSDCEDDVTASATFTVTEAPVVALTAPEAETIAACTSQEDVNTAFTNWLTEVSYSGGCNTTIDNDNTGAPAACGGSTTVTWTVSSDCEDDVTASATFTVTEAPVVTLTAPEAETIATCTSQEDVNTAFTNWLTEVSYSGGCNTTIDNDNTGAPAACGGSTTVTWTVSSDCEDDVTASATFTVTEAPVVALNAPEAETIAACTSQEDVNTAFTNWLTEVSYSGGCNTTIDNDNTGAPAACGGSTTVTWTVSSDCEDDVTASATFTVTEAPVVALTAPEAETIAACTSQEDVNTAFTNWLTEVSYSGGCNTTIDNDNTGAPAACGGSTTVTWTVSSDCEDDVTASATFTVTEAPVVALNAPEAETIAACTSQEDVNTAFTNWLTEVSYSGGCNTTIADNNTGAPAACGGSTTVTWTVSSDCEDDVTASATFTVTEAPVVALNAPEAETIAACTSQEDVNTAFTNWLTEVSYSGGCNTTIDNDNTGAPAACGGSTTVTWTVSSDCEDDVTASATFTVTRDTDMPTFTVPADITIAKAADCSYNASVEATGDVTDETDNCDTGLNATFSDDVAKGDCEGKLIITRTWRLTDDCENTTEHVQTITVEDQTTPTFNETLPTAEITAECDAVVEAVILTASDNCDSDVSVVFTETRTDGNCANNYTLTRVWTATDDCGNETSFTQTVVVSDNTAPTFNETLPTTEITAECDAVVEAVVLTTSDNCDTDVPVVFTETKTDGDCANNYTLTRTWTATDNCGNETSHTQTVVVSDNTAPEVTCNDITVQLEANGSTTITVDDINGGTTDACSDIDTMYISQATFDCDNVGENEVTLTVIDECGNASTCTATVTVEEGDANCGLQPFKANDDILTLVYCPDETISGELDLFANDEGFTPENVNFTILTDLPEGVSVTDGNLLYANENPAEAVITFTYSVCHTVNTENCSTAEVTIQLLVDTDCDGVPDIDDLDDDDDGILDIIEEENALDQTSLDSDGDGIVDRLDIDADNDGIVDNVEWQSTIAEGGEYDYIFPLGTDSNGDGWDDAYDPASNGITYDPWDMDLDGTPDYLDTNTDNEGEDDNVEGWDKFPNDSIADVSYIGSDTDKDGLDDAYDTYNTTTEEWAPGQNAIGSDAYLQDTDDDGVRDWRDAVDNRTPPEQFACGDPVIPNAFSPNQDGYNDYFKVMIYCTGTQGGNEERVLGDDFSDARIEIFNRWGNLVYEQERYGNEDYWGDVDAWWNGRSTHNMQVGSDQLPTATYYYILYFNDGNREPITGFVFLNN